MRDTLEGRSGDGLANVVIPRKGARTIRSILMCDLPLEPCDRIVDILELDYDPTTGLSLYVPTSSIDVIRLLTSSTLNFP